MEPILPTHGSGEIFRPVTILLIVLGIVALAAVGSHVGQEPATPSGPPPPPDPKLHYVGVGPKTTPPLPPPGMQLAFNASFSGTTLDTQVWSTCYWYSTGNSGCAHFGSYPENEWYLPSQDVVSNGVLNLVTSPTPTAGFNELGQPEVFPCRSGMITTDPSFAFTYGYVQVVARMPKGQNTWPALWMLPADHSDDLPEIDLMEIIGTATNRPAMSFHPVVGPQYRIAESTADLSSGWHTFGLDWEQGSITWYIDGTSVFSVTAKSVPSQPMYFLANDAITDAFRPLQLPSSCSATMSIKSVQVWQKVAG
jgi:beta-glucanase (GH16 family)